MTALAIAVPYQRVSPLYAPRRDLVLTIADSLSLLVTVTETDTPGAALIDLATGPTFPAFFLRIWQDSAGGSWDYGGVDLVRGTVLAEYTGTISTWPGTVEFTVPADSMARWPRRCLWAVEMDHDTTLSETLMAGALNVGRTRP